MQRVERSSIWLCRIGMFLFFFFKCNGKNLRRCFSFGDRYSVHCGEGEWDSKLVFKYDITKKIIATFVWYLYFCRYNETGVPCSVRQFLCFHDLLVTFIFVSLSLLFDFFFSAISSIFRVLKKKKKNCYSHCAV